MDKIKSIRWEHYLAAILGGVSGLVVYAFIQDLVQDIHHYFFGGVAGGLVVGFFRERWVRKIGTLNDTISLIVTFILGSVIPLGVFFLFREISMLFLCC